MKRAKKLPAIRFTTGLTSDSNILHEVMPFRRSWTVIAIVAVLATVFLIPAITTFNTALLEWGQQETLFDLVSALFLSLWLLGWSVAPLFLTGLLLLLLTGREILSARPGIVKLSIGIPGLMAYVEYDVTQMRNLKRELPQKNTGNSWRGPHMVFDYEGSRISFGSDIDMMQAANLSSRLAIATGSSIREENIAEGEPAASPISKNRTQLINKFSNILKAKAAETAAGTATAESQVRIKHTPVFTFSTLVLVLANLVPVIGALYFGWDLSSVLVIYWAESAVIGFYNICKILVIGGISSFFYGIFFISHFGAFMAIHFMFLYQIFIKGMDSSASVSIEEVSLFLVDLWPAILALFVSHGISFIQNFLGRKEYLNRTAKKQMSEPYQRIVFMHLVIIIGAGLSTMLGEKNWVIMMVIAAKVIVDIRAHAREREIDLKN